MNERKSVPAAALRFTGEMQLGDNGESSKTAPFAMVARSGDAIEHWYWGKVIHDLSGMRLNRGKVAIDYEHDPKEIIGYANHFSTEEGDLKVEGALTPTQFNTRATEVIELAKQGVPFEASINFGGDGIRVEEVEEGRELEVNGRKFSGPGVVIRQWPLRGIAITPYGADSNTSTTFSNESSNIEVEIMSKQEELTAVAEVIEEQVQEAVEVAADIDNAEAVDEAVEATESLEQEPELEVATLSQQVQTMLREYHEQFGAKGYEYAAEGLTLQDAMKRHLTALSAENAELRAKLSAAVDGEPEPLKFSEGEKPNATGFRLPVRIAK